jgi:site-specific recombinase XerC
LISFKAESQRDLLDDSGTIRKLPSEVQRCGYVDSETAQAIITVAGVSQKGRRLGRWLAWEEARTLLQAPNPHSIRGMRDLALLGVLVTCALRRGELSRMNCEHLTMRDGRWVFLDFLGKGTLRTRMTVGGSNYNVSDISARLDSAYDQPRDLPLQCRRNGCARTAIWSCHNNLSFRPPNEAPSNDAARSSQRGRQR